MPDFVIRFIRLRYNRGSVRVQLKSGGFERDIVWENAFRVDDKPYMFANPEWRQFDFYDPADRNSVNFSYRETEDASHGNSAAAIYDVDSYGLVIVGRKDKLDDAEIRRCRTIHFFAIHGGD